jgi:hypothetical protein
MSTASLALARPSRPARRLVGAEFLKLRRRRALLWASVALIVAPVLLSYALGAVLHAGDPAKYGPAGGAATLADTLRSLTLIGAVAFVLMGVNAGGGDLAAGVFRELVVTGRSRLALFAARIPGGLALLLPLVALAFAIAAAASVALAAPGTAPGAGLLLRDAAWLALAATVTFSLALGVSSLLDSRATAVGLLLAWHLAVAPLLLQSGKVDFLLPNAALDRLQPDGPGASLSPTTAVVVLAVWTLVPLGAGAWRTHTRDA